MTVSVPLEEVASVTSAVAALAGLVIARRSRSEEKARPLRPSSLKHILNTANDTTRAALEREREVMTQTEFAQRLKQVEANMKVEEKAIAKAKMPRWAFGLMAVEDAHRYDWEWNAHLLQLIEEGELRQARRDRRRFVVAAVVLAVILRVRRALGRAR